MNKRACVICGRMYTPIRPTQKYCSRGCREKSQYPKHKRVCLFCGKEFIPMEHGALIYYCSRACREMMTQRRKGALRDALGTQIKCAYCGKLFYSKTIRKYCSDQCRHQHYYYAHGRHMYKHVCEDCGVTFQTIWKKSPLCKDCRENRRNASISELTLRPELMRKLDRDFEEEEQQLCVL